MKHLSATVQTITNRGKMIRFLTAVISTVLVIHGLAVMAAAMDVTLQWDPNDEADYYVVYYGTESGTYNQNSENIPSPTVSHTVTGLPETTWYFSVKAFNQCGNSSDFSDEIVYVPVYSPLSVSIESPVLYTTIIQGETLNFQSLVSGGAAPLSYAWNFGAGGPAGSALEDPGSVVFNDPGTYTVSFTVTDANGAVETATVIVTVEQIYVDVYPVAGISSPEADITITEGDSVSFEGLVTGGNGPFVYAWDFGSPAIRTSSLEDPGTVVFDTAGVYTVTFTVTDSDGDVSHDTVTITVDSRIIDVEPVAAISSPETDVTIVAGGSVNLSATVSGGNAPFVHAWNFSDSRMSGYIEEDPGTVVFSQVGVYTVTYTVTDADGDTSSASRTVAVVEPDTNPAAAITSPASSVTITQGGSVNFAASVSSGNAPYTHLWNFGSSAIATKTVEDPGAVTFSAVGAYTVTYTVTDADGDTSSASRIVTVIEPDTNPTAAITSPASSVTITQGGSVNFAASVSSGNAPYTHSWNFGSSAIATKSVEDPGAVTFSAVGAYTVTYTVTDADGDTSSASRTVTVVEPDTNPAAAITSPASSVTITQGGSVNFAASVSSGNAPYTHSWNFGSSAIATKSVEDPGAVTFSAVGAYTVTYTVTDADGDTSSASRTVTVVEPDTNPTAAITSPASSVTITQGGSVNFAASVSSGNAPYTHSWNFGSSAIATKSVEDPGAVTFSAVGAYTVTYTVTDADGDTSSASRTVTVVEPDTNPTAAITSPASSVTITQGGSVNFAASVSSGNAPYTHLWSFGSSAIASKTVEDPGAVTFSAAGTYTVTYAVTDADGDTSSASRTVTVTPAGLLATITSPASSVTIVPGSSVNFQGKVENGVAPYKYRWYFGYGGPKSVTVEDPGYVKFPTAGTYLVTFIVTDKYRKVSRDTVTVTVAVGTKSVADPEKARLVLPAEGARVSLTPTLVADAGEIDGDTQWQVSLDESFTQVVVDATQAMGSSEFTVPTQALDGSTTYHWRMKHNSAKRNTSSWSDARTFVTEAPAWNDHNGNGVPDSQETDENNDINHDGEADHGQDLLKTVKSYNGNTSFGLLKIDKVLDIELLEAMDDRTVEDRKGRPGLMPYGLIGFRILTEQPGDSVLLGICLADAAPENAGWFKYDTMAGWQDYSSLVTFSEDRKTLVVELEDGGAGDADGCMNGVIVDPAGLGIAVTEPGDDAGVTDSSSGGGSGCFIGSAEEAGHEQAAVAILLAVLAFGLIARRRAGGR